MEDRRMSGRLRGESPEITQSTFRCFCLNESWCYKLNTISLDCRCQYVHFTCLCRLAEHTTGQPLSCPFCRARIHRDGTVCGHMQGSTDQELEEAHVMNVVARTTHTISLLENCSLESVSYTTPYNFSFICS